MGHFTPQITANQNNTSFTLKGILVWLVCVLMSFYEFMLSNLVGTFQAELVVEYNLSSFQFSLLSSTLFLFFFGLMQFPAGLIVERFGLKKSLLISSMCIVLSCLMLSLTHHYAYALFSRGLMGFGASFCLICLMVSVRQCLPSHYQATFIGISQFIATLGPLIAAGPMVLISHTFGYSWRDVFFGLSGLGAVLFLMLSHIWTR